MAVGGTASIFRIDAVGEGEADAETANQTIEFNTGAGNPDARGHLSSVTVELDEDTSSHPNPNRHLTQWQANKLGTIIVTFRGYFDKPTSAGGITRFINWMTNDKTNAALKFGRFGIRVNNMSQLDLTPSGAIGYILKKVTVTDVEEYQSRAEFVAVLYRNGAV
jgi:hypothetical protein